MGFKVKTLDPIFFGGKNYLFAGTDKGYFPWCICRRRPQFHHHGEVDKILLAIHLQYLAIKFLCF